MYYKNEFLKYFYFKSDKIKLIDTNKTNNNIINLKFLNEQEAKKFKSTFNKADFETNANIINLNIQKSEFKLILKDIPINISESKILNNINK